MEDAKLRNIVESAQEGNDDAFTKILNLFKPILYKYSFINGLFNPDCFQVLSIKLLNCIKCFDFNDVNNIEKYFNYQ